MRLKLNFQHIVVVVTMLCISMRVCALNRVTQENYVQYGFSSETYSTYLGFCPISSVDDLFAFADSVNAGQTSLNAVLIADIILNDSVLDENGELRKDVGNLKQWNPIGTETNPFNGTFDGQGFAIFGLYVNSSNDNVGLFGYAETGIIENVGIEEGYVSGNSCVGSVCGTCRMGTISKCYNLARIEGANSVGGICGWTELEISSCYNLGTITASESKCGGICGTGNVTNSYNVGYCNGNIFSSKGLYTNCYFDKELYGGYTGKVFTDPELLTTTSTYGISLSDFVSETLPEHLNADVWNAGTPNIGEITAKNNEFATQEIGVLPSIKGMKHTHSKNVQLYNFGDSANPNWLEFTPVYASDDIVSMSANYVVMQNFQAKTFIGTQESPFVGNFSGNRYTITFSPDETPDEQGLFLYSQGTIMRVNVLADVSANKKATGLCVINEGTISSCSVNGTIATDNYAGGICVQNDGTIYDCVNFSKIKSDSKGQGGCCCFNNGTINSCINEGSVECVTGAGICNRNDGVISNCINNANISYEMGGTGIVYENYGTISNSCTYVDADSTSSNAGATKPQEIVAYNSGDNWKVENCYAASNDSTMDYALSINEFCNGNLPDGFSEEYWDTLQPLFSNYTRYKYYPILTSELCSTVAIAARLDTYYNLTLNGDGGSFTNITLYVGGEKCILPSDVVRTGHTFVGWYDNSNFNGTAYTEIPETATGDKSFYAKWSVNYYSVNLFSNGGKINSGNVTGYYYGSYLQLPTDVTKTGYTFKGWKNIPNAFVGVASLKEGTRDDFIKMIKRYTSLTTAEVLTKLDEMPNYALFSVPNVYISLIKEEIGNYSDDVMYGISGGISYFQFCDIELTEVGNDEQKLASLLRSYFVMSMDEAYKLIANAPITVATNIAYATAENFKNEIAEFGAVATLTNGYSQKYVTAIYPTDRGDKYLQADWEKQTYEVTLHTSGGTILDEPVTEYSYGTAVALPKQLELKGYTFKGWYSNSYFDGLPVDTIDTTEYGNKQYWARWVVNCDIQVSGTITPTSCFGYSDGKIELAISEVTEPVAIQWVGMESTDTLVENLSAGNYQVVVTDDRECSATKTFTVSQPDEIQVSISEVVNPTCGEQSAIRLETNGEYTYKWSNGSTEKDLISAGIGEYEVIVTEPITGCSVQLSQSLEMAIQQPEIALVTVSKQSGKNLIVWVRENTDLIDYYTIYRESQESEKYEKIATVPFSEISVYEDVEVDPAQRSWSYKISATDFCGNETVLSDNHATIHLNQPQSLREGFADLSWNAYVGLDYSSYYIIRETKVQNYTFIDTVTTVPASIESYSAEIPSVGKSVFYVGIKLNTIVNPKEFLKAESGPFTIAISNIAEAENEETFIHNVSQSTVEVYAIAQTIYVKNAEGKNVQIYDNVGRCISQTEDATFENAYAVRLKGVYFVMVDNESFAVIVK